MKEITYETAKRANTIARQLYGRTQYLKSATGDGRECFSDCEIDEIEKLTTELRELLFPLPF